MPSGLPASSEPVESWSARIPLDGDILPATAMIPADPRGAVILVRGTHGVTLGLRSRRVASALARAGYVVVAPALWALSGPDRPQLPEPGGPAEPGGPMGADLQRAVDRLVAVTAWTRDRGPAAGLPLGYFATSTAAAIALGGAARLPGVVAAVVVRAGCPDHAGSVAGSVTAATLLIVGGADPVGVGRSGEVEPLLRCPSALEIIPGASPLFTEAGAMDRLVALAVDWYGRYLGAAASSPG